MIEPTFIQTKDKVNLKVEIYGHQNKTTLIINPAIGVKRKLYRDFATFMAQQDTTVVLYNYRGMEDGTKDLPPDIMLSAEAWGRVDQSAVINWVTSELKPDQLFLLGHSIGGQLLGFADSCDAVDGLVHIASQKGDYRLWPFVGRLKLILLWHVLIPWMSKGKTFNAKKLGLGTYPWPSAAAKQWAHWGQQKDYLFNPKFGFDLKPWHQFDKPLLSLGFLDDDMAPEAAIDGLLKEFGQSVKSSSDNGHIEKRIIDPKLIGLKSIGHFGFFRPETQTLWQEIATWIHQQKPL